MRRLLPLLALAATLTAATAVAAPEGCPPGLHPAHTAELFFGRDMPGDKLVSDSDWQSFIDTEVTPRFPDGLTVDDVYGQWKNSGGQFVRESSKALFIVLTGASDEGGRLDLIRTAYKSRFQQESVLLVEQKACVSF